MYLNVARRSGDGHSALLVHWSSLVKFLPLQAAAQTPTMPSPKAEAGGAASGESSANPSPEKVKAASASASASGPADWRAAVPQAARSEEVRAVAGVLAGLEPGATASSKLMLAMRFEDSIFQQAGSLADYRKKLAKRLKKVQKSYKAKAGAGGAADGGGTASAGKGAGAGEGEGGSGSGSGGGGGKEAEAGVERELRRKYGESLAFIVKNADAAIRATEERHGSQRADQLRQHTDNAEQWAVEIGMAELCPRRKRREPREAGYLDRLRGHLAARVGNIRSHVVKASHPDLFLEETIVKLEDDLVDERAMDLLASATAGAIEKLREVGLPVPPPADDNDWAGRMRSLLEQISAPIAPLRRGSTVVEVRAADLARLDKLRAAADTIVAYLSLDAGAKTEARGCLSRLHRAVSEQVDLLVAALADRAADEGRAEGEVWLEDAWNRPLEFDAGGLRSDEAEPPPIDGAEPEKKRARVEHAAAAPSPVLVMRSRVLLTRGRKAPSNLVLALQGKKAELIQPTVSGALCGAGTLLRMEFGGAFEMTVHFVPLLVAIRALPAKGGGGDKSQEPSSPRDIGPPSLVAELSNTSNTRKRTMEGGLPTWIPTSWGLASHSTVTALGVTGSVSTLGPLVANKLEYASACATRTLRRCFAELAGKAYAANKSDFEVEISEATGLLRFVQIARSTYTPQEVR